MIFVFLRNGKTLYKKGMCERIYDYHFQLKENFDLTMGNDVINIQMYAAKIFLLNAGMLSYLKHLSGFYFFTIFCWRSFHFYKVPATFFGVKSQI